MHSSDFLKIDPIPSKNAGYGIPMPSDSLFQHIDEGVVSYSYLVRQADFQGHHRNIFEVFSAMVTRLLPI